MTRSEVRTVEGWRSFDWLVKLIALLLFVLLLLLWWLGFGPSNGCCAAGPVAAAPAPAAVVPPAATAPAPPVSPPVAQLPQAATPASVSASVDGGKLRLTGLVPDESTRNAIVAAATARLGAGNVIDELRIDGGVAPWPWAQDARAFIDLLASVTEPAAVSSQGTTLTLTGSVPTQADFDALDGRAKGILKAGGSLDNRVRINTPPAAPVAAAVDCRTISSGIHVEFASNSTQLSDAGKRVLDAVLGCLGTGRYQVGGHTDNRGAPAYNLTLSQSRAAAVVDYLRGKGIAADRLVAKGFGQSQPVADNKTSAGRASNRRVSFSVLN